MPLRRRFLRTLTLAALASGCVTVESPPPEPEVESLGPGWFDRYRWPNLKPLQLALARSDDAGALEIADGMNLDALNPPEQMWRAVYVGIALDRLHRRPEAIAAYQAAAALYPHSSALAGLKAPLTHLKHLDAMAWAIVP